jgi:hypothetical protein
MREAVEERMIIETRHISGYRARSGVASFLAVGANNKNGRF